MAMNGIDISKWQSGLLLKNVASDFVIIKATEGVGYKDPKFDDFMNQALALNKRIGVYHFARPYAQNFNSPKSEADWFVSVIQPYIGRVMLVLDWEAERKNDSAWAKAWLDRVKELTGVLPVFYTYESCINSYNFSNICEDYPLWVARYLDYNPDYNYNMAAAGNMPKVKWWLTYIMWQWTSSGRLDGWGGNLDCNIFYGDGEIWDKLCAKVGDQVKPPEAPIQDTVVSDLDRFSDVELAEKVWAGEFGNGEQRRQRLGVRYESVQKIVNQGKGKNVEPEVRTYTVQPGDTLSSIAKKFNTTYQRIAMDNGLANPNLIYPGQIFTIK